MKFFLSLLGVMLLLNQCLADSDAVDTNPNLGANPEHIPEGQNHCTCSENTARDEEHEIEEQPGTEEDGESEQQSDAGKGDASEQLPGGESDVSEQQPGADAGGASEQPEAGTGDVSEQQPEDGADGDSEQQSGTGEGGASEHQPGEGEGGASEGSTQEENGNEAQPETPSKPEDITEHDNIVGANCWNPGCQDPIQPYLCPASTYVARKDECILLDGRTGVDAICCQ